MAQLDEIPLDFLSLEEQRLFFRHVSSGQLSQYIDTWTPWWTRTLSEYQELVEPKRLGLTSSPRPFIEELNPNPEDVNALTSELDGPPSRLVALKIPRQVLTYDQASSLPPVSQLCGLREPSFTLPFNLVDILYAYVKFQRLFNGDWSAGDTDALAEFISTSAVLASNQIFTSLSKVVTCCVETRAFQLDDHVTRAATVTLLMSDIAQVLSIKIFVMDALVDAASVLHHSRTPDMAPQNKTTRRQLRQCEKKLQFYLAWVASLEQTELTELSTRFQTSVKEIMACL